MCIDFDHSINIMPHHPTVIENILNRKHSISLQKYTYVHHKTIQDKTLGIQRK